MSAHRYWRIFCTQNAGAASFTTANEVEFHTSIGGSDVTGSGTAISGGSGSDGAGNDASKAFDNNTGTQWARTSTTNTWIGYDFGAGNDQDIVELAVTNGGYDGRVIQNCSLDYSDNGSTWTTLFSFDIYGWLSSQTRTIPETQPSSGFHRYWRVFATTVDGGTSFTGLSDIQFRATHGGSDQTTNVGSDTASSSGRVVFSTENGGNDAYRAYSGLGTGQGWFASGNTNQWNGYVFPSLVTVTEVSLSAIAGQETRAPHSTSIDYSDDGVTWTSAATATLSSWVAATPKLISWTNAVTYNVGVTESGSALDTVANTGTFGVSVAESGAALDSPRAPLSYAVFLAESGTALDTVSTGNTSSNAVAEQAHALDVVDTADAVITEASGVASGASYASVASVAAWSVLTGSGDANYPASNLADLINIANVARVTPSAGAAALAFDVPAGSRLRFVGLARHNLLAAETMRIRLYSGPGRTGTLLFDSGVISVWPSGAGVSGYSPTRPYLLSGIVTAASGRLDFAGLTGTLEIGGVELANWFDWAISPGVTYGFDTRAADVALVGGGAEAGDLFIPRTVVGQIDFLALATAATTGLDFQKLTGKAQPFVFVQNYGDPTSWARFCFLAKNTDLPPMVGALYRSDRFQVRLAEWLR